jgi:transcriptional regulator of acetoin/glycerol metabolism
VGGIWTYLYRALDSEGNTIEFMLSPDRDRIAAEHFLQLEEVGELLPEAQIALLRVLHEKEIERVGGNRPVHVNVRVLAATNCDLSATVASGSFRADLFERRRRQTWNPAYDPRSEDQAAGNQQASI